MTIQLKDRGAYAAQNAQNVQEAFDTAMASADGAWTSFVEDPTVKDAIKVEAAKLLDTLMSGLTGVTSVQDVRDLVSSFNAAHSLASSPEIAALVRQAEQLDSAQQASLATTAGRVANGQLELRPDGSAMRPRLNQGGNGQQQTGATQASTPPPAQPAAQAPQPAAPAQPAAPQGGQPQGQQNPPQAPPASQPAQPAAQAPQPAAPAQPAAPQGSQPQGERTRRFSPRRGGN